MDKFLSNGKLWLHNQNLPVIIPRIKLQEKVILKLFMGSNRCISEMERNNLKVENTADIIKKSHEYVRLKIKESNTKYKKYADQMRQSQSFQEGNMVMVCLHKERLPNGSHSKLSKRKIVPYKIIKKIEENV